MKISDLALSDNEIKNIASKVLKYKETNVGEGTTKIGSEVYVHGKELDDRLNSELLITIQYTQAPLSKSLRVTRFWGNRVLIDINGMNDSGKRKSRSEILGLITTGLKEYFRLASNTPYGYVDIDNHTG